MRGSEIVLFHGKRGAITPVCQFVLFPLCLHENDVTNLESVQVQITFIVTNCLEAAIKGVKSGGQTYET